MISGWATTRANGRKSSSWTNPGRIGSACCARSAHPFGRTHNKCWPGTPRFTTSPATGFCSAANNGSPRVTMVVVLAPSTPAELAHALREAAAAGNTITLCGNSSKRRMAGPIEPSDVTLGTTCMRNVLQYEPRDLTVSVSAGLPWRDLTRLLSEHRQMIPLDPPFADEATVGGVVAANSSGPRRRQYGTARDFVIGMQFATLEGKLVQSGGMVVKNVAGLDMGKLMIGSFGTLAAIAVVNFKLIPGPAVERSFLMPFESLHAAIEARNGILKGALQPAAIDLLNPQAGAGVGNRTWLLAMRCAGNIAAVERYERELAAY